MRRELFWHGGNTLVVFEDCDGQFVINICGAGHTNNGPRDAVTGRPIKSSLCLTGKDIQVLEDALKAWRALYPS